MIQSFVFNDGKLVASNLDPYWVSLGGNIALTESLIIWLRWKRWL